MTKKSAARLARDEHMKNNTAWDDLNKTRDSILAAINTETHMLAAFFGEEPLMQMVPESQRDRVKTSLDTLRSDNAALMQIFNDIAESHKGKTGRAVDEKEGVQTYQAYLAYMDLVARFEQLDQPVINYLNGVREEVTFKVAELEVRLAEQAAAREEQNEQAASDQPTTN